MNAAVIEVVDLEVRYGGQLALRLGTWTLRAGEFCAVSGPSGSGKSTLLAVLAGLLRPHRGSLRVCGEEPGAMGEARRDRFRGRHIGIVPQTPHLMPSLSLGDNLLLAQFLPGLPQSTRRASELLGAVGLAGLERKRPHELSRGQAQRVAIARALMNQPSLLLVDEPTANLDDRACEQVMQLLERHASEAQASLVVATHDARVLGRFRQTLALERVA